MSKLGKRAVAYVEERGYRWRDGGPIMVPDDEHTPPAIARTLTRVYGEPTAAHMAEEAFWAIGE